MQDQEDHHPFFNHPNILPQPARMVQWRRRSLPGITSISIELSQKDTPIMTISPLPPQNSHYTTDLEMESAVDEACDDNSPQHPKRPCHCEDRPSKAPRLFDDSRTTERKTPWSTSFRIESTPTPSRQNRHNAARMKPEEEAHSDPIHFSTPSKDEGTSTWIAEYWHERHVGPGGLLPADAEEFFGYSPSTPSLAWTRQVQHARQRAHAYNRTQYTQEQASLQSWLFTKGHQKK